jgi:hypothetical protein
MRLFTGLVAVCLFLNGGFASAEVEIKHSFFIAGPEFTGIIDEAGEVAWDAGRPGARDGWVLPNGNVLVAWSDVVQELKRDMEVVFEYRLQKPNQEIGTAQRLANGNTLITELGSAPRLREVTASGEVVVDCELQPETTNAHMQTRMARKLENGNYLVPHLLAFKVKEYAAAGQVVREIATDLEALGGRAAENWPFTAIMLPSGNVLVNLTHGNRTVEFNPAGEVAWTVSNDDFSERPFDDSCGVQRLPNGNTVVASYHAQRGIKLTEVTRDKKIVWTYTGPQRAHHFHILTTNGEAVPGTPLR